MAKRKATSTALILSQQDEQLQPAKRTRMELWAARKPQRDLDPRAVLPGEDAGLRAVIAACTRLARKLYREKHPDDLHFQLAGNGQHRSETMNWEELLVWGNVLAAVEDITGVSRENILRFAKDTCSPTNGTLIELEIERTLHRAAVEKALTAIESSLPYIEVAAKFKKNQRERSRGTRKSNRLLWDETPYEEVISSLRREKRSGSTAKELWASFEQKLNLASSSPTQIAHESGDPRKLTMKFNLQGGEARTITFGALQNAASPRKGKVHT